MSESVQPRTPSRAYVPMTEIKPQPGTSDQHIPPLNYVPAASGIQVAGQSTGRASSATEDKPASTQSGRKLHTDAHKPFESTSSATAAAAVSSVSDVPMNDAAVPATAVAAIETTLGPSQSEQAQKQLPAQSFLSASVAAAAASAVAARNACNGQPASVWPQAVATLPAQRHTKVAHTVPHPNTIYKPPMPAQVKPAPPPAAAVLAAAAVATLPAPPVAARPHLLSSVHNVYRDPEADSVPRVVTGAGIPVPVFPVAALPLPGASSSAETIPVLTPKRQGSHSVLFVNQISVAACRVQCSYACQTIQSRQLYALNSMSYMHTISI
jgi:hypothetical protein